MSILLSKFKQQYNEFKSKNQFLQEQNHIYSKEFRTLYSADTREQILLI